jgi:serine/threonine protein kinase
MELCDKSLKDVLNATDDGIVPEHLIWKYLADVVQGLHHVHKHTLVHLDLKPENMLVGADGGLKIADMGNAIRVGGASSQGMPLAVVHKVTLLALQHTCRRITKTYI